ncbi:MAG: ATP-grasp domain-containing protein [Chloroherpetonaceae bacterium]|nr:ATP-grasp domain-containing protein [Chloroherpetonaceae bacterium]MCS7210737.1 ATP-grasp domain-containing protein [Chloroherpetonaceae bacterium]MDW8019368.1 ATP-grasp domain-containing protein [Chloroherpetonaceae bacterium]MDW8465433.1 ATP-grasp domain-containing protein [Chloroherpetonaceae bacterium]
MPVVVFVAPLCNAGALASLEALASLPDVTLGVISAFPQERLPEAIRARIAGHWQTHLQADADELLYAASKLRDYFGRIDCIFSSNEHVQEPIAQIREHFDLPGLRPAVAHNFRNKAKMKALFQAHQIPCARFQRIRRHSDAHQFIEQVGFPIILKPTYGAGSASTFRVDSFHALQQALWQLNPSEQNEVIAEEFLTGEEHSLETVMQNGKAVWQSVTRYLPSALEAMQNQWIQWRILSPREAESERYADIRAAGAAALKALGLDTGISHLEWFRRPDGSLAISEVGARPPGAQILTLHSRSHSANLYAEWVRLMIYGEFNVPKQRYASGVAFLRGQGSGTVKQVIGLDDVQRELGTMVTDMSIPQFNMPPTGTYEGEGFIIVRHERTEAVEQALSYIINTVRVFLG